MNHNLALQGRIEAEVIDAEGNVTARYGPTPNLLLNQGMDKIPMTFICDLFNYAAKGTGTLVTKTAVANSTTQTASTLVGTGNPFVSGMVGMTAVFIDGAHVGLQQTIIGFTDANTLTLSGNGSYSGHVAIYATNQTGLVAEAGNRSNTYSATAGDNSSTTSAAVRTNKRTFIFDADTAGTTYTEVGFSDVGTAGNNLNIRVDISSGGGITVPINQRLKLSYSMTITVSPSTSTAIDLATVITDSGNVMSSNKNANWIIETFATSRIATDGFTDSTLACLEPAAAQNMALSSDTAALVFNGNTVRGTNETSVPLTVQGSYANGSYQQIFQGVFDITDANRSDLRSLMLYFPNSMTAIITYLFAVAQTKDSSHALSLVWTFTWGRTLT